VVVTNDRVVERAAVGIAWKAVTRLVIATKRRRLAAEVVVIMMLFGRLGVLEVGSFLEGRKKSPQSKKS
jgi:hypothetical protein